MFGSKRDKVVGGWRRLHNEELYNMYVSPSIIRVIKSRRMRWVGHIAWLQDMRNIYQFRRKPWNEKTLGRYGDWWEDNIKI